jgi:AraC-like DNA-binding protein
VYETGYFDQSHLTHALKRFIGYTPAQLVRLSQPSTDKDLPDAQFTPDHQPHSAEKSRSDVFQPR